MILKKIIKNEKSRNVYYYTELGLVSLQNKGTFLFVGYISDVFLLGIQKATLEQAEATI